MKHLKLFESWSDHGKNDYKMSYPRKVYRGYSKYTQETREKYNKRNGIDKGWVKYYTDDIDIAKTYGSEIEERMLQLNHAFIWNGNYQEYNDSYNIVDTLENCFSKVLKTGEDQSFNWFGGEVHTISKHCDGIIIENIVDPCDGGLDWTDEEYEDDMDGFEKALWENASTVYIIPYLK